MFGLFKKRAKITVTHLGESETGASIRINCQAPPAMAMGLLLGALTDIAERFQQAHNSRPNPCDCISIRYANLIVHHIAVINNEMKKVKIKK